MSMILPDIPLPFPRRINPLAEAVERHIRAWARRFGLVSSDAAARRFDDSDYGGFAARAYCTAAHEDLALCAEWLSWYALLDDQLSEGTYNTAQAWEHALPGLCTAVLHPEQDTDSQASPAVRALADMCRRTFSRTPSTWYERFAAHLLSTLRSLAAEATADRRLNGDLDIEQYLALRRATAGVPFYVDLIELAEHAEVPEAAWRTPAFQELVAATTDLVCLHNDLYSLDKELARGNVLNLVLVLERVHGMTRNQALEAVAARATQRVDQFCAARHQLQASLPHIGVDNAAIEKIGRCVTGMQDWVNGNLEWCQYTPRYGHVEYTEAGNQPSYVEDLLATPCPEGTNERERGVSKGDGGASAYGVGAA
ncbi:MAG: terpene synthase family protein [Pseudonocardiaceae bacterium]